MQAEICGAIGRFEKALRLLDETMELMQLQDHSVCENCSGFAVDLARR